MVAVEDISHEKRVAVLQRTFFHDVLNTAGCIQGYADYLASDSASDPEVCQRLSSLSGQLIEEIQSQRDLLHAESGELKTQPVPLKAGQVLEELRNQYLKHPVAENRSISIGQSWDGAIITDRQILNRVLGNMLKNALEATSPGGTVTLSCIDSGDVRSLHGQQPGGHAQRSPTSGLPAVVQHQGRSGPRNWNVQHETVWGTVLGRPGGFREPFFRRDNLPAGVAEETAGVVRDSGQITQSIPSRTQPPGTRTLGSSTTFNPTSPARATVSSNALPGT